MVKKCLVMIVLGLLMTPPLCWATIQPITSATVDKAAGTPPYYLKSVTVGSYTVPVSGLRSGTSTSTLNPTGGAPLPTLDNFELNALQDTGVSTAAFAVRMFGGKLWKDSNGDNPDFFLFEGGGDDTPDLAAILPGGVLGQTVRIPPTTSLWGRVGAGYNASNGGAIVGVAFAITDLLDANGKPLTNDSVIEGLAITNRNGLDPADWCAVAGAPVLKAMAPNPADGAFGVTTPLFQWSKGDEAVFHNVYFGTTADLKAANLVAPNQPFAMYFHVPGLEAGVKYYWRVDEVDATGKVTTGDVWSFTAEPLTAYAPKPTDGGAGLFPAPTLSWVPGKSAVKHQVYLSSSLADVEAGAAAASKGTITETKLSAGALRASTTYYWRVDELTADGKVNKGPVWSFTTADGIAKKIIAQWWFNITGGAITDLTGNANYPDNPTGTELRDDFRGPFENQYDYYGMRVYGWLTPPQSGDYTFWVAGNDVGQLSLSTDADPANAKVIATSPGIDPRDWANGGKSAAIPLKAGQKYFIMALQKDGTGRDHVSVAWQGPGIPGQVLLSSQYVDTFALPPLQAFSPSPANGQADAPQDGALSWSAGEKAQKHDVYFGADKAAVAAADTKSPLYKGQQSGTSFNAGDLEWNKTYYWRVDEINAGEAGSPWKGAVWSFTTANFIVVDNMESYTDQAGSEIFTAWVDGFADGFKSSGSTVGIDPAVNGTFGETGIVHGGKQSMPMDYDNTKTPFFSEAVQTFSSLQNWTVNGVTDLSLWVRGNPVSFVDKGNGAFTVGASGHDIWDAADDFRFVYKRLSGDGSVTVKVESLVNTNGWAKAGVMIRQSLDADSAMAYMIQSFSQGASFGWRQTTAGTPGSQTQTGIVAPQWVKLTRTGNAFTAQYSADGKTWTDIKNATGQVVSTNIMMTGSIYIGLCTTSHDTALTTTAQYSGAATTGGVTGAWQVAWVGDDPDRTNGAASLYVAVEDSAGKVAIASDPALANAAAWTQWKIPLSSLTGVNLGKVKKLTIGVGDKKNPVADGSGRIYIDDIRVTKP